MHNNHPSFLIRQGHKVLSNRHVYSMYQYCVGTTAYLDRFLDKKLNEIHGTQVIDLGCGPRNSLRKIPKTIPYFGVDISREYLTSAKSKYPWGNFIESDLLDQKWLSNVSFASRTSIIGLGILHHLDDTQVFDLIENLSSKLPKESKLFFVDPTIEVESTRIAKWFASHDRGQFVRSRDTLSMLLEKTSLNVTTQVTNNELNIPFQTVETTITLK